MRKTCPECGTPISVGFRCADCADRIEIYSSSESVMLALKWGGPAVVAAVIAMAVSMIWALWRLA